MGSAVADNGGIDATVIQKVIERTMFGTTDDVIVIVATVGPTCTFSFGSRFGRRVVRLLICIGIQLGTDLGTTLIQNLVKLSSQSTRCSFEGQRST